MNQLDPLENQLRSWTPRHPSAEIAARLFPRLEKTAPISRWAASSWNWLTPVAACFMAMLVIGGNSHRLNQIDQSDHATFFASIMVNANSNINQSVAPQTFALNKQDVNLEWNVWPHSDLKTTNL